MHVGVKKRMLELCGTIHSFLTYMPPITKEMVGDLEAAIAYGHYQTALKATLELGDHIKSIKHDGKDGETTNYNFNEIDIKEKAKKAADESKAEVSGV